MTTGSKDSRKKKLPPTLEGMFFSTAQQRVGQFLATECTTAFNLRQLSTRLKGVRGLGGIPGLTEILLELEALGLVDFVDNRRSVRFRDDNPMVPVFKIWVAVCRLENLKSVLDEISVAGILVGAHADGTAHSGSRHELIVLTTQPDEVARRVGQHPMAKEIKLTTVDPDDAAYKSGLERGIPLWGRKP